MNSNLEKQHSLNERQQQLLADLNREIAANQINNARAILTQMEENEIKNNSQKTDEQGLSNTTLKLSSSKISTYNSFEGCF